LISVKLQEQGYVRVKNSSTITDYIVIFNYKIDDGTTTGSLPLFGQTGGGYTYGSGSVYSGGQYGTYSGYSYTQPTYGQIGSIPFKATEYQRILLLNMIDINESSKDNVVTAFEGRVISRGSTGEISKVLPTLIEALFRNFPGESGKTKKIILPLRE
jgi:hypothetical protein